jgi:SAM-dependent methyltransferase
MAPPAVETDPWLDAMWPRVRSHLPETPCRVLEIGCGRLGGFVPALVSDGYDALGVDPEAPEGSCNLRARFEDADLPDRFDALVACTSLHHVANLDVVAALMAAAVVPGGVLVVVEWAWERLDEDTARWGFERLGPDGGGWLRRRHDEWATSGGEWAPWLESWARGHGLHRAEEVVRALDRRFERRLLAQEPYLFSALGPEAQGDEQAAIDAGRIRATRVDYVGVRAGSERITS